MTFRSPIYTPHSFGELDIEDQYEADTVADELDALKQLEATLVMADRQARALRDEMGLDTDDCADAIVNALDALHLDIETRQQKLDAWDGACEAVHVAEERAAYRASVL